MWNWIAENAATILVAAVVLAVLCAIVYKMIRDKRQGKVSCSCGCGGCPMRDACHKGK